MNSKLKVGDKVHWHNNPLWIGVVLEVNPNSICPYHVQWISAPSGAVTNIRTRNNKFDLVYLPPKQKTTQLGFII